MAKNIFKKALAGIAIVGTLGGWSYGRFFTEKTEEVTILTVADRATEEQKLEGKHEYRITTDKGIFRNDGGVLALKFGTTTEDLQSYFKEGKTYKVTSYDPLIGDRNVTDVIPTEAAPRALSGESKDITLDFNGSAVTISIPVEAEGKVTLKDVKTPPAAVQPGTGTVVPETTAPEAAGDEATSATKPIAGVPTKADLSVKAP